MGFVRPPGCIGRLSGRVVLGTGRVVVISQLGAFCVPDMAKLAGV